MILSVEEAANYLNVGREAILSAIRINRLKAEKTNRWNINIEDLQEYEHTRYKIRRHRGDSLYKEGELSIKDTAVKLGVPLQHIYYAIRQGNLKSFKRGYSWIIKESDVQEYKNKVHVVKKIRVRNIN